MSDRDDDAREVMTLPTESRLAVSLAKAEIDQQISTARAYPRNVARVIKNILSLATIDEGTSASCIFSLPRGGKPIIGPSIRLAEIVSSQWGNNRTGARVVDVNRAEKYVEAEGIFHDLETNAQTTKRVKRRIVDSRGRIYSDDMIIVTGNAACSIALRNAILGGVPRAVWAKAEEAARQVIAGDVQTLSVRRDEHVRSFSAWGVKPAQVYAALGVEGIDDITLNHMPMLAGMHSAIKNQEASVEEIFPPAPKPGATGQTPQAASGPTLDRLRQKFGKKPEPPAAEPQDPVDEKPKDTAGRAESAVSGQSDLLEGDPAAEVDNGAPAASQGRQPLIIVEPETGEATEYPDLTAWSHAWEGIVAEVDTAERAMDLVQANSRQFETAGPAGKIIMNFLNEKARDEASS